MSEERRLDHVEAFVPLRPVTRRQLMLRAVLGPIVWIVALVVVAIVVRKTDAILLGVVVAAAGMAISVVLLALLRVGRNRERRRYGDGR
jgi:ABC-type thiamin/hydroxymethylpyrimidine transport system permease subunit